MNQDSQRNYHLLGGFRQFRHIILSYITFFRHYFFDLSLYISKGFKVFVNVVNPKFHTNSLILQGFPSLLGQVLSVYKYPTYLVRVLSIPSLITSTSISPSVSFSQSNSTISIQSTILMSTMAKANPNQNSTLPYIPSLNLLDLIGLPIILSNMIPLRIPCQQISIHTSLSVGAQVIMLY